MNFYIVSQQSTQGDSRQSWQNQVSTQASPQSTLAPEIEQPAAGYDMSLALWGLSACALVFFMSRVFRFLEKGQNRFKSFYDSRTAPCSRCRFFSKNPHLRCAVHPQIVDKLDAKNCPDFWQDDQDKFKNK